MAVELKSEKGVDYTRLRELLAAGEWKEADQETGKVMCQSAGRETQGWLDVEDINTFPCEDLRTINQLWLHYSNGKFGFSVQKEIYVSLGGTIKYDEQVWKRFCHRVGWRKGEQWFSYSDPTLNIKVFAKAHFPRVRAFSSFLWVWVVLRALFLRLKTCEESSSNNHTREGQKLSL